MKISDVLIFARNKYKNYGSFVQKHLALNADGKTVRPNDPKATCWCMMGAILSSYGDSSQDMYHQGSHAAAMDQLEQTIKHLPYGVWQSIASINDHPDFTQLHAIKLLNKAITQALDREANDNVFRCFYNPDKINPTEEALSIYRADTAWWKAHCGDMIGYMPKTESFPIPASHSFDGWLYP